MTTNKTRKNQTFDFRTILFLDLIIMVFMLLSGKPEVTLLSFFVAVIVLISGRQYYILIRYAITFGVLYFYYYAVTHMKITILQAPICFIIGIIAFIIQRIIPFMMLGSAIKEQKNLSEITTALEKCRLPKGIILSIAVMFRHFTSLKEDFFTIVEAMKLKGIDTSWKRIIFHPLKMLEYLLVPMLFRSLHTAEEFSCAALVKGIENTNCRSAYFDVKIRKKDILFSVITIIAFILSLTINFLR